MDHLPAKPHAKRRGAQIEPPNRFESLHREADLEHLEHDEENQAEPRPIPTQFLPDKTRSILAENSSPDVGFRWSINPYRGCEHGCAYCFARPTHETLGWNAGLDFETKILVKYDAADLLRAELAKVSWTPEPIALSGVTDCYQPIERRLQLTRACLEVMLEAGQPVVVVTKNALVLRDLDLLSQLAARRLAAVCVSLTTLDAELARSMEPRTSAPRERLGAIRRLAEAGIPVRVLLAPIIPGLTDSEIPQLLAAAQDAGARAAGYVMLRLPGNVLPVFFDWLQRSYPLKKDRVESRIRAVRGGKLYHPEFGSRMRGEGVLADEIEQLFRTFAKRHGLDGDLPELDTSQFLPPKPRRGQLRLF